MQAKHTATTDRCSCSWTVFQRSVILNTKSALTVARADIGSYARCKWEEYSVPNDNNKLCDHNEGHTPHDSVGETAEEVG